MIAGGPAARAQLRASASRGEGMAEQRTPDDIKIIAQFLASQSEPARPWQELTREAFNLRRQLKQRGGFRLARQPESRAD